MSLCRPSFATVQLVVAACTFLYASGAQARRLSICVAQVLFDAGSTLLCTGFVQVLAQTSRSGREGFCQLS